MLPNRRDDLQKIEEALGDCVSRVAKMKDTVTVRAHLDAYR
jgi:hypothetical protein